MLAINKHILQKKVSKPKLGLLYSTPLSFVALCMFKLRTSKYKSDHCAIPTCHNLCLLYSKTERLIDNCGSLNYELTTGFNPVNSDIRSDHCAPSMPQSFPAKPKLYFFLYLGVPGQGHQQHRWVEPLHEDRQLVQVGPQEVQVPSQMGQALQMPRWVLKLGGLAIQNGH